MRAFILLSAWVLILTISILVPKSITTAAATAAEQVSKLVHEGNYLYTQKKYEQALESFKKVLAVDSNNTYAIDRIGLILYNLGKEKDAIKYFDKSLAINPNNTSTLNSKGLALGILGNHTAAIDFFDKALSIDTNNVDAHVNKGTPLGLLENIGTL